MKHLYKKVSLGLLLLSFASCGPISSTLDSTSDGSDDIAIRAQSDPVFKLTIHSNNHDEQKSGIEKVMINVESVELKLARSSKEGRYALGNDIGLVDLLQFDDANLLDLTEASLVEDLLVKEIRIILEDSDNFLVFADGSECELQTPSAQKSGLKLKLKKPILLQRNKIYSVALSFDVNKSIVIKGNGDCLLKPVLKIESITEQENFEDPEGDGDDSDDPPINIGGGDIQFSVEDDPDSDGDDEEDSAEDSTDSDDDNVDLIDEGGLDDFFQ